MIFEPRLLPLFLLPARGGDCPPDCYSQEQFPFWPQLLAGFSSLLKKDMRASHHAPRLSVRGLLRGGTPSTQPLFMEWRLLWVSSTENTGILTVFATAPESVVSCQEREAERDLAAAPSTECSASRIGWSCREKPAILTTRSSTALAKRLSGRRIRP